MTTQYLLCGRVEGCDVRLKKYFPLSCSARFNTHFETDQGKIFTI